jgi:hypothetical protein
MCQTVSPPSFAIEANPQPESSLLNIQAWVTVCVLVQFNSVNPSPQPRWVLFCLGGHEQFWQLGILGRYLDDFQYYNCYTDSFHLIFYRHDSSSTEWSVGRVNYHEFDLDLLNP